MLRIEHKLDLILHAMKARDPVLTALLDDPGALAKYDHDTCPVCNAPITIVPDFEAEGYSRNCACSPPVPVVQGISALLHPPARTSKTEVLHLMKDIPDGEEPTSGDG